MLNAAEGFELPCGREYGFGNSELPSRNATQLHTIPESNLAGMPTENISTSSSEQLIISLEARKIHAIIKYNRKNRGQHHRKLS